MYNSCQFQIFNINFQCYIPIFKSLAKKKLFWGHNRKQETNYLKNKQKIID